MMTIQIQGVGEIKQSGWENISIDDKSEMVIETHGLSKSYDGVDVLKSLNLQVPKNSIAGYFSPCSLCFAAMVSARFSRALKSASDGKPLARTGSITSTLRLGIIPANVSTVFPPHP